MTGTTPGGWPYVLPADHPLEYPAASQAVALKFDSDVKPGGQYGWAGASGWSAYGAPYSDLLATRVGGLVVIQGALKRTSNLVVTAGSVYQCGNISSSAWRPPQNIPLMAGLELGSGLTAAFVYVNADGTIQLRPVASGTINTGQAIGINGAWRAA